MKFPALVLTDLHINDYRRFNAGSLRLNNCLQVLQDAYEYADANKIGYILFPGDLYDTPKQLLTTVVNATAHTFKTLTERYPAIVFLAISGNHDQGSRNLWENPAVTALEHLATLFPDRFILLDNRSLEIAPGIVVHGIPYYEFPEHFSSALDFAVKGTLAHYPGNVANNRNYLLIHQTPPLGSDVIAPDFELEDPRLASFDYILCGHIHGQTQVAKNLLLVGSPLHRDAADEGRDKGFVVMDLAAPAKGWKPVSLKGRYPEFISVPYGSDRLPEHEGNFILVGPPPMPLGAEDEANAEQYSAELEPSQLLTNFWQQQTGGEDKELLAVGLKLLLV